MKEMYFHEIAVGEFDIDKDQNVFKKFRYLFQSSCYLFKSS